ncbi:hypothetical protein LNK82_19235 [Saccharothrix sp. NEAU-S10]|nr:hypothetical protein [Saccharothrix luteola]MCC8246412.1 hypothetical protein [Saccharothrix luteola]
MGITFDFSSNSPNSSTRGGFPFSIRWPTRSSMEAPGGAYMITVMPCGTWNVGDFLRRSAARWFSLNLPCPLTTTPYCASSSISSSQSITDFPGSRLARCTGVSIPATARLPIRRCRSSTRSCSGCWCWCGDARA